MAQLRIQYLEQSTVERAIVSRQEAIICDLENKTEFQKVQIKRFEVPRTQELLGAGAGRGV
jgi:myosin-18